MASSAISEQLIPTTHTGFSSAAYELNIRRIYILPTRQGVLFFFLLIAMLFGAINYNNSLAYMLTFLLGSLYMITILHTYRNLAGLSIRGTRPEPVFAGSNARFPVVINSAGGELLSAAEGGSQAILTVIAFREILTCRRIVQVSD